tara:strand:- start:857 stop:1447 length:591 start_codon:yes stop_codon:yes gene_type:complete
MDTELLQTSSPEIKCSICLDNDIEDNVLCSTGCSHQFCKGCLDEWFDQGKVSCPMCRAEINYFKYQGENNRIVKVTSNRNQTSNLQLINILNLKIKSYKLLVYFMLLYNLYTSYYLIGDNNSADFYKENYIDCMGNLTDRDGYISKLIHNNNELQDSQRIEMYGLNDEPLSLVRMLQGNTVYQCLFPEYYVDKCID